VAAPVGEERGSSYRVRYTCLQNVELCVSQLKMYGSVWWLNAAHHVSRARRSAHLLTVVFVFKSCVVVVAHEVSKDRKKNKVTASFGFVVVRQPK